MSSPALASTSMCLPAPHVSIIMLDVIWNRERLTGSWTRNTQECICEDFLTVLETYERYRVTMLRYSIHADIPIVIAHNRSKILRVLLSYYRDFFFVSLSFYTILLLSKQNPTVEHILLKRIIKNTNYNVKLIISFSLKMLMEWNHQSLFTNRFFL